MDRSIFFSSQAAEDDEDDVEYVLGHRPTNGMIEYLVRFADPRILSDQWVKATDLTCYHKILDHYEGRVPADIEIRPPPNAESTPPVPAPDDDSNVRILGFDTDAKGNMSVRYEVPGVDGVQQATRADFAAMHQTAFINFLEKTATKKT
jgi:hypothetical protein